MSETPIINLSNLTRTQNDKGMLSKENWKN